MRSSFARPLAFILAADAALVLPLLATTTLWNVDEGRIAEIAREMAVTGEWTLPRLNGAPFPSYPPLSYWLMSLSGLALGFSEFAMRLPGALAGIALVGVVGAIGRRIAGDRAGLVAAVMLATTPGFVDQQLTCRADVLATLAGTSAFAIFLAIAEGDRRLRTLLGFYVVMALGLLAKGPIAVAIPGLGIVVWCLLERRFRTIADLRPWIGVPVMLAITLPWYLTVHRSGGDGYLYFNLALQNVTAFTTGFEHAEPVYFYFKAGVYRVLPWILFLPLAWRLRGVRGLPLALGWLLAMMLLLTLSAAKRINYLTYAYPALALSAGIVTSACLERSPRAVRRLLWVLAAALATMAAGLLWARPEWRGNLAIIRDLLPPLLAGAAGAGVVLFAVAAWRGPAAGVIALALVCAAGLVTARTLVGPRLDQGRGGRAFIERTRAAVPAGAVLASLGPWPAEGYEIFYWGRLIPQREPGPGYFLARAEDVANLRHATIVDYYLDHRERARFLVRIDPER